MEGLDALADALGYAEEFARSIGRTRPLTVAYIPEGLTMGVSGDVDPSAVLGSIAELEKLGVSWVSLALPGESREEQLQAIDAFGTSVLARLGTR
jgi:hypothetical protein